MSTDLHERPLQGEPAFATSRSSSTRDGTPGAQPVPRSARRANERFNGIIRDLRNDELAQFRKHLQRLDGHSLRDRFNGGVSPEFLADYATRSFGNGTVVAGYFERGVLRGAGELHPIGRDGEHRPIGEIAFSVLTNSTSCEDFRPEVETVETKRRLVPAISFFESREAASITTVRVTSDWAASQMPLCEPNS